MGLGQLREKFPLKKVGMVVIASVFLSSVLIVFMKSSGSEKKMNLIIQIPGEEPFKKEASFSENETILDILSRNVGEMELENGELNCIGKYCNNENSKWAAFRVKGEGMNKGYLPIESKVSKYQVSDGETISIRYVSRNATS